MIVEKKWKDIKGYEGLYSINKEGVVKSYKKWRGSKERILKPFGIKYLQVALTKNGVKKYHSIHRLVAKTFLKKPKNMNCINHKNSNKKDNRVENLEWCDYSHNIREAYKNGLRDDVKYARGEKSGQSLLTEKQVREIRKMYKKIKSSRKIAKKYNLSKTSILNIINKKTWNHLS